MTPAEEIRALKSALAGLYGWLTGGACADCEPFRSSPCEIDWQHHKDCGCLASMRTAGALLGYPPEECHDLPRMRSRSGG